MTTMRSGADVRSVILGSRVEKSTGTLTAATVPLFTISGGLVAVTSLVARVTTAVTVANSYKLQLNPTAGTTVDLCAALDIGTTKMCCLIARPSAGAFELLGASGRGSPPFTSMTNSCQGFPVPVR